VQRSNRSGSHFKRKPTVVACAGFPSLTNIAMGQDQNNAPVDMKRGAKMLGDAVEQSNRSAGIRGSCCSDDCVKVYLRRRDLSGEVSFTLIFHRLPLKMQGSRLHSTRRRKNISVLPHYDTGKTGRFSDRIYELKLNIDELQVFSLA
jgi:hypothetical protein